MRILVTGSNGLLGQKLLHVLHSEVNDLIGCDLHERPYVKSVELDYRRLDLTQRKETLSAIRKLSPHVIIHTAAMTGVDRCELEKEACWRANVTATENVVKAADKLGAKTIFISTDYVFDGTKGPYKEDDSPNPLSYYGRSKLAAENAVRGSRSPWVVVRTIVLYGNGIDVHSSFIRWLLGMLRRGSSVNIVDDQWGNTTLVDDLASGIERIILLEKSGIFHIGGSEFLSRYEFAVKVAEFYGLRKELIIPISTNQLHQPAKRPIRSGLLTDHAEKELFISFLNVEESLKLYRSQEEEPAKF